jgi:hypothetical protein
VVGPNDGIRHQRAEREKGFPLSSHEHPVQDATNWVELSIRPSVSGARPTDLLDLLFRKHSYMKLIGLKDCFYRHIKTEIS